MKPHPFEYIAPTEIGDVIAIHGDYDVDSALLAGGQTLVPLLNMRMALPEVVVDLKGVERLDGYEFRSDGTLRLGAMTRQRAVELAPDIAERFPLLIEAMAQVAHVGVRTRGTIGGSLCYAEPAAELPAVMTTLEAKFALQGPAGERLLDASDFFFGPMTTAVEEGEVLTGVEISPPPSGTGTCFLEVARTHGAFALVEVSALLHADSQGRIDRAGLTLGGVAGVPWVPQWLDEVILGEEPGAELFEEIGQRISQEIEPMTDGHADAAYRRRVAGTLVVRALSRADRRRSEQV